MVISTSKSDTMLKKCLGSGKTAVISIDRMIEQFIIDPTTTTPQRDC